MEDCKTFGAVFIIVLVLLCYVSCSNSEYATNPVKGNCTTVPVPCEQSAWGTCSDGSQSRTVTKVPVSGGTKCGPCSQTCKVLSGGKCTKADQCDKFGTTVGAFTCSTLGKCEPLLPNYAGLPSPASDCIGSLQITDEGAAALYGADCISSIVNADLPRAITKANTQICSSNLGKCLGTYWGNNNTDKRVYTWDNNNSPLLYWDVYNDGTICSTVNPKDCITAPNIGEGTKLTVGPVSNAFKWTRADNGSHCTTINGVTKCIDIPASSRDNGALTQLWTGNNGIAQLWEYDKIIWRGRIVSRQQIGVEAPGKLSLSVSGLTIGSNVITEWSDNNDANQIFLRTEQGYIIHEKTGLYVGPSGDGQGNNTVVLKNKESSNANKWVMNMDSNGGYDFRRIGHPGNSPNKWLEIQGDQKGRGYWIGQWDANPNWGQFWKFVTL